AETPMTLGGLADRVAARAAALHALGVRPRDPVAVYTTAAADQILAFLALTRLGAIPALVNGNLSGDIAAEYIRRLRAVGVLTDQAHRDALAGHDCGCAPLADVAELGGADPADAPPHYRHHGDDPIAITHSSGTTGLPKAIVSSHASLFAATRHLRLNMPRAQGTERVLSALPAAHTATILAVNQALCNRSDFLALSTQRGGAVLEAIERYRPAGVLGFAVTWAELARVELTGRDLSSVRIWFNTGDCAHEPHIRHLVEVGGHDQFTRDGVVHVAGSSFIDGLGSTEMGHSLFHLTHRRDTDRYGRCIGRPHRFAEAVVLDLDGHELPADEIGHLGVRSPSLSPGYWNDSVTTYRSRLAGYYLTGDLVRRDAEGYFYHVDRSADSVSVGAGGAVYTALSEERILTGCPDVLDCTVMPVREGDAVVTDVYLLLAPHADQARDRGAEIRAALGEPTAGTVRQIVVVDADGLPTGATGKIRKRVLREEHAGHALVVQA
ncbi:MAG: class I adenylate-forming enzyme family protein, partial [Actinocatenispora sp.]